MSDAATEHWRNLYGGAIAALALVRVTVECHAPGSLPPIDPLNPPPPNREAEAICRAIDQIAISRAASSANPRSAP